MPPIKSRRVLTSVNQCAKAAAAKPPPNLSSSVQLAIGYAPERAAEALAPLLIDHGGRWQLSKNGRGLERQYRFLGFRRTWEFMNEVAAESNRIQHHPEWSNVYNCSFIRWTTHYPQGLSEKDVIMAKFCDQVALRLPEVKDEEKLEEDKLRRLVREGLEAQKKMEVRSNQLEPGEKCSQTVVGSSGGIDGR